MKLVRFSSSFAVPVVLALVATACGSAGSAGVVGKEGAPGEPGKPAEVPEQAEAAINLVEPHVGLLARQLEVTIGVDGKLDLSKAEVDFGDGIEVVKVAAQGPALVATIEIAPNARLGKHDVVVDVDGQTLTAKHGFVVAVHLDAKVGAGKAEQGGLVRLDISNRDEIWFDAENFTLFPLVGQKDPSLVGFSYQGFTETDGSVIFLGDPLAKTGPLGFLGFNDPSDQNSASYLTAMDAVTVAARKPVELAANSTTEAVLEDELETGFYSVAFAPAANEALLVDTLAAVPPDSSMSPLLLAYPESGTVAELLDQGRDDPGFPILGIPATEARVAWPVTAASKAYFIVMDSSLGHGPSTKTSITHSVTRAQIVKETASAHATGATAQGLGSLPGTAVAIPGRVITGELTAADEIDVYRFTGLSAVNATDMLVSVIGDTDVVIRVDTVPTFDSDHLVEIVRGGQAGVGVTAGFVGQNRYIEVAPMPDSKKPLGKYTLGIKRVAPVVTPP
ncbi:MAG: hypothetical protein KF850_25530 [Labilithrix sp.]|nr:hypothetical protein [Labilithrix sp.]